MTADSDDTIPQRVEDAEMRAAERAETDEVDESDEESLVDRMRDSGVGVEDPNIVGDAHPGPVDAEIAEDDPPQV